MNKLLSLVGSMGSRRWRLKEVFVLAILLVVAVASTESTIRASIHEGDSTLITIGPTKPTQQVGNTAFGVGALVSNTTGSNNTAIGSSALSANTEGHNNTAIGEEALRHNVGGRSNTAVGQEADVRSGNLSNATAIGAGAIVDASNKIRLGNANVTRIEGQVGFTSSSDARQKENLLSVDGEETLHKLRQITVGSWNYKGQDPAMFRHYGPTAQEFFAAFGHDDLGTIGNETTITSTDIDGIMMVAIQALEKRTVELQAELRKAREELAQLRTEKEAGTAGMQSP
jgi:trimeric autotransporter adhesin